MGGHSASRSSSSPRPALWLRLQQKLCQQPSRSEVRLMVCAGCLKSAIDVRVVTVASMPIRMNRVRCLMLAGEAADGSFARERLRKQKMEEGVSKKAARQPWMGERAKKLEGAAPKGKGSLAVKLPTRKGVHRKPGSATRPAAAGQPSPGPRRGKPLGKGSAGRKAHSRPTQTAGAQVF